MLKGAWTTQAVTFQEEVRIQLDSRKMSTQGWLSLVTAVPRSARLSGIQISGVHPCMLQADHDSVMFELELSDIRVHLLDHNREVPGYNSNRSSHKSTDGSDHSAYLRRLPVDMTPMLLLLSGSGS